MGSDDTRGAVLPYRTDPDDILRFLVLRARGREPSQIRTLNFAPKNFEGTVAAVDALALLDDKTGDLTELGRRYAASSDRERPALLREIMALYPPYALLCEAIQAGGGRDPTPLEWIETWWASHRFGSSESNRAEAAPVFAKFAEAAGLGSYIQGRKGHVSRIEWTADEAALPHPGETETQPVSELNRAVVVPPADAPPFAAAAALQGERMPDHLGKTENLLTWQLSPGREVNLRLPADLTGAERSRLLRLFELLLQG